MTKAKKTKALSALSSSAISATPRAYVVDMLKQFRNAYGKGHGLKAEMMIADVLQHELQYDAQDKAFLKVLLTGVLRYWIQLDAVIERLSDFPTARVDPSVKSLLQIGLFQLRYLDSVPDYAAMGTTVALAKEMGLSAKSVAFINGMLRSAQRQQQSVFEFDEPALRYSVPQWFWDYLCKQYGQSDASQVARILKTPPPLCLRINTRRMDVAHYCQKLDEAGIAYEQLPQEAVLLKGFHGHPGLLPGYDEGLFYVQDPHSLQVAPALIEKGFSGLVIDLCAAPGSKATHLAEMLGDRGKIIAVEPVEKRARRLKENIERLGHGDRIEVVCQKAQDFSLAEAQLADAILVDAPCSGMGTIRRHPEILLQLQPQNFGQYQDLQMTLLEKALTLLKPAGRLIYSTCSILDEENEKLTARFTVQCPEVTLVSQQALPLGEQGDGFYIAAFSKVPDRKNA